MKKLFYAVALAVIFCSCNNANGGLAPEVKKYYKDSLAVLTERCAEVFDAAYMQGTLLEENQNIPNWEGYPVKLYEYFTGVDINTGERKRGLVYMLNPEPEKLAKWIVNAVWEARGALEYTDIERVRKFIMWQSGAQFPVSGVVYEDMYTKGYFEPYIFKDGVTVYVADSTKFPGGFKTCTDEMLDHYIHLKNSDLKPNTGKFARICSTTREMYYKFGGKDSVGTSNTGERSQAWLDKVATLYKEAWHSDRNELISAWANWHLNDPNSDY